MASFFSYYHSLAYCQVWQTPTKARHAQTITSLTTLSTIRIILVLKILGHGLDPTLRAELRQRHQEILDTADVKDGFIPLARDLVSRPRTLRLPEGIDHRFPLDFFMLFFTMNMFITIRDNTNVYAALFYIANTSNSHQV